MTRAAIYRRISRDPDGLREGVQRQDEDTRALAGRLGLEVVAEFEDNDTGASTLSKKPRDQYGAMLEAAQAGHFDAILAYSNSRLTRRPRELEDLLDVHDRHGVKIHTVVSGSDDLATADGRMTARIKASVDAAEAERTGERLRRAFLQRAQSGAVNQGGRPFGWQADKVTLDPTEAALVRRAAQDVIDGVGLRVIVRRWNEAGVTTTRGNTWDHRAVRQLLKAPRLAGWRIHRGEVARDASGAPVRGVWSPLLDQDTHDRLVAALSARTGHGGRRGARKYLLSGVARCAVCGARMYATPTPEGHAYVCRSNGQGLPGGHTVSVTGLLTDEAVSAVVVAALAQETLDAPPPAEFAGSARLAELPELVTELMTAFNSGVLSGAVVFPQVAALEAEQAALTDQQRRWRAERATTGPTDVDPEQFALLDSDRQRAVCERLFQAIVIAPAKARGARWTPDRITYVWRTAG